MKKQLIAAAVLSALAGTASAQAYIGTSAGVANANFKNADFTLNSRFVTESKEENKAAYKLFGGYQLTQYLALEGGYTDLGKFTYKYSGTGILNRFAAKFYGKADSWNVAAVGRLPIGDFALTAKVGIAQTHLKASATATIAGLIDGNPPSKNKTNALLGIGAEYSLDKKIMLRAEYENYGRFGDRLNTGRLDIDMLSLGVAYKF